MNDLKTEQKDKVEKYLVNQLNNLYLAYNQEIDVTHFEKVLYLISTEFEKKSDLNKSHLDKAYNEMLTNYIIYRKMCASSYLTAFAKVNKK